MVKRHAEMGVLVFCRAILGLAPISRKPVFLNGFAAQITFDADIGVRGNRLPIFSVGSRTLKGRAEHNRKFVSVMQCGNDIPHPLAISSIYRPFAGGNFVEDEPRWARASFGEPGLRVG